MALTQPQPLPNLLMSLTQWHYQMAMEKYKSSDVPLGKIFAIITLACSKHTVSVHMIILM